MTYKTIITFSTIEKGERELHINGLFNPSIQNLITESTSRVKTAYPTYKDMEIKIISHKVEVQ